MNPWQVQAAHSLLMSLPAVSRLAEMSGRNGGGIAGGPTVRIKPIVTGGIKKMLFFMPDDDLYNFRLIYADFMRHSIDWLIEEYEYIRRGMEYLDKLTSDSEGHEGVAYFMYDYLQALSFAIAQKSIDSYCMSAI